MRPEIIFQALLYLKQSNSLYYYIDIALDNIPRNLLSSAHNTNDQECDSSNLLQGDDNPLDLHSFNSKQTMFMPNVSEEEEIHIAPGEGKQLKLILNDGFCKELSFPYLFPKGKFGLKILREVKLQLNMLTSSS